MHDNWTPKIYSRAGFVKNDICSGARALDVGCGARPLPGAIGMDILKLPNVDVVHDFNQIPWPFEDNSFDLVLLNHALEHVDDVIATMNEIHRVLKSGGRTVIQVPYFRSADAYNDPTHRHFFTSQSLEYIVQGSGLSRYRYSDHLFIKKGFWYGWPHSSRNPLKQLLKSFVAAYPQWYDQHLSLLFPTECLTWELEASK